MWLVHSTPAARRSSERSGVCVDLMSMTHLAGGKRLMVQGCWWALEVVDVYMYLDMVRVGRQR